MNKAKKLIRMVEEESKNYLTTYCNQYHDIRTGKPIDHECITIPPEALKAEMGGDYEKAIDIIDKSKKRESRMSEQQSLAAANCEFYNEKDSSCTTGCVRAVVNVDGPCPFVSKFDSHQSSCPCYVPAGGVPDRRFHV